MIHVQYFRVTAFGLLRSRLRINTYSEQAMHEVPAFVDNHTRVQLIRAAHREHSV